MARRALHVQYTGGDCPADRLPLTIIDLFAGAGGISEGFRQAGFRVLGGVDHDPDAAATYRLNFPEAQTIVGDVRVPEVHESILDLARAADVVVGGPPCQAFSQVRNHSRVIDDPRNSLYTEFVGVLRAVRPRAFLMENVTGMDQMGVRAQIAEDPLSLPPGNGGVAHPMSDAPDQQFRLHVFCPDSALLPSLFPSVRVRPPFCRANRSIFSLKNEPGGGSEATRR